MNQLLKLCIIFAVLIPSAVSSQSLHWVKNFGGTWLVETDKLFVDNYGNVYSTGQFRDTVDFDPGPGTDTLIADPTGTDVYITKLSESGSFCWARHFTGPGYDYGRGIAVDNQSNVYISGYFENSIDLNPGLGISNHTSVGVNDIYVTKLDSNGNFIWSKSIGGINSDAGHSISIDLTGNVYVTGDFRNTVDFDPGPGLYNLTASGADMFILKLDPNGNFIWVKQIVGSVGWNMTMNSNNQLLVTGSFGGTQDFDPGPGTFNLTSSGSSDCFIIELDTSGSLNWAVAMGGTNVDIPRSIKSDYLGNVYLCGYFSGTNADFDPSPGISLLSSNGGYDVFVVKLNSVGGFDWAKSFGSSGNDDAFDICVVDSGKVNICGKFLFTVDFNPGAAVHNLTSAGISDAFINQLDSNGNFLSVLTFGGLGYDGFTGIAPYNGSVYTLGSFQGTVDFDPDTSTFNITSYGDTDGFILKLSDSLCTSLQFGITQITNISCTSYGLFYTNTAGGAIPYQYAWDSSPITYADSLSTTTPGIYTCVLTDNNDCQRQVSGLINGPSTLTGMDLGINLVSDNFRPGFNSNIWLYGGNYGCIPINGQMKLLLDPIIGFLSAVPPPDIISGDTLIWNFNNITYDSISLTPHVLINTPTTAVIGDSLIFKVYILPESGDIDSTNNTKIYQAPIVNGYDPNDKKVYPAGECDEKYLVLSEPIIYTIRFQNTGNADAINIHIIDSLNNLLNINSIKILGTSHPMITEVLPDHTLKFRFDNIHLPDSNSNEPDSHGFIIFEISLDSVVPIMSSLTNMAHIYFDYNPAVITNQTENTLIDIIPNCYPLQIENIENLFSLYPNPTYDFLNIYSNHDLEVNSIKLYDTRGSLLNEYIYYNQPELVIDLTTLEIGIYIIQIESAQGIESFKVIKN